MLKEDLENRFKYHPPANDEVKGKHETVRNLSLKVALLLNDMLPEGREKSLAITHLEEVMMWSNAALARDSANSAPAEGASGPETPSGN